MTNNVKDINEVLDDFAHDLVEDSTEDAVSFDQKVDAFKALTAYAALRFKMHQKGGGADEDGETTMDDLRDVIAGAGETKNGRARVRDH